MATILPVAAILSSLETRIAEQREQETFHAEREAFHREQREQRAAELERLVHHREVFQAAEASAAELAVQLGPTPALPGDDLPPRTLSTNKLVARVVEDKAPDELFDLRSIHAEVNRRFAARLKTPLAARQVSVSLRWLAATGRIFRLEKGRPHSASKYARRRPPE
jgi:hypothetical protein